MDLYFVRLNLKMEKEIAGFIVIRRVGLIKLTYLKKIWNLVSECARDGVGEVSVCAAYLLEYKSAVLLSYEENTCMATDDCLKYPDCTVQGYNQEAEYN